ncbi:HupE/UreJ family protein [Belliella kenyensis]|uniref:HupE/UreJ family protein n=1 Tax=Belliella kenyensis TaxID=1472724 RepID=A0ABV8ENF2_9BACT|nr:HupE/UreJ family protein [Belliella kenyensis]MCH7401606.1 HupE/UreJ family protein [Belliella kenyensis]MDN3603114.1 HupE/UreJ family protein [Belliella kenyensis]
MGQFRLYFELGYKHILDINGFDHILFVIALCAIYLARDWKKIIILITAFTIGHSITLAMATLNILRVNANWIEFLIPVTIAITALANIIKPKPSSSKGIQLNYIFAIFFGLIHGLGFSNYLRSLLGREASIFQPLLAFNIGLEVGQLLIVAIFLISSSLIVGLLGVNRKEWTLVTSAIVLGMSIMMMIDTKFW